LTFALVLDGLRDPGNLGTILRTADAAGVQAVFLAPGTVDAYNPKVVRAAMGAHFHVPLVAAGWTALAGRLRGLSLWLAEARQGLAYDQVDWRQPSALIIGAEAAGPGDAARRLAPKQVSIPMPGQAESLNAAVAAGIILFEAARQRAGRE
jgi:TrmH family RNA methyltransferase